MLRTCNDMLHNKLLIDLKLYDFLSLYRTVFSINVSNLCNASQLTDSWFFFVLCHVNTHLWIKEYHSVMCVLSIQLFTGLYTFLKPAIYSNGRSVMALATSFALDLILFFILLDALFKTSISFRFLFWFCLYFHGIYDFLKSFKTWI